MKKITIAIDGYSSCGKSTFAKAIAARLGYLFIDTGSMYRAVTLYALENAIVDNRQAIVEALPKIEIEFRHNPSLERSEIFIGGRNVDQAIRSTEVSDHVSGISAIGEVRHKLVAMQQQMGRNGGVVMDGRDIGTVVFPDAEVKIFMTADVDVRAQRRYKELTEKGVSVSYEDIKRNISDRDRQDESREISPLRRADDALLLDNSLMTPDQQIEWLMKILDSRFGA